jgi:hypothetical protein
MVGEVLDCSFSRCSQIFDVLLRDTQEDAEQQISIPTGIALWSLLAKLAYNTGRLTARRNSMRLPQQTGVSARDIARDIFIIFHLIVKLHFPPLMHKTGVASLAVFGRDWGPLATEFGPTWRRHFVPLPPSSARPLKAGT